MYIYLIKQIYDLSLDPSANLIVRNVFIRFASNCYTRLMDWDKHIFLSIDFCFYLMECMVTLTSNSWIHYTVCWILRFFLDSICPFSCLSFRLFLRFCSRSMCNFSNNSTMNFHHWFLSSILALMELQSVFTPNTIALKVDMWC